MGTSCGVPPQLADRCKQRNIQFSCTPFYLDAVKILEPHVAFLQDRLVRALVGCLVDRLRQNGKPVILSTGMATIDEIKHAVEVLNQNGCKAPTLLHAISAYPAPYAEANLAAIETLRQVTGCEIGWSDHTVEPAVIHRAIHRWGARVIEFHLDLDGKGKNSRRALLGCRIRSLPLSGM
jgi:N-acetylneuraminate synthase